jgi:hypothetical protein
LHLIFGGRDVQLLTLGITHDRGGGTFVSPEIPHGAVNAAINAAAVDGVAVTAATAERLLAAALPHLYTAAPRRWVGVVTRWDPGSTSGFITAGDGLSWFVSDRNTVSHNNTGIGPLPVGTHVTFVGRPSPRPGKKYPEAFTVEVLPSP